MTHCEHFDTLIIRDICKVLNQKNRMWSDFIGHTQPKVACPLNTTSIKVSNATVDLGYVSYLPLDGYTWITSLKLYKSVESARRKKELLFCIMNEATITKTRRESGKK